MSKMLSKAKGFVCSNAQYMTLLGAMGGAMIALAPTFTMAAGGLGGVLSGMGTVGAIIIGIAAIIVLIMEVPKIAKGEKAVGSTVAKVGILFLLAGLMIVATNIEGLKAAFGGIANSMTSTAVDATKSVVGS